jgi:hypothetical protein
VSRCAAGYAGDLERETGRLRVRHRRANRGLPLGFVR